MERYRASHDNSYPTDGHSHHFRHPLPPRPDDLNHHHHLNRRSSPPPNLQHPGGGGGFNSSPPRFPPWIRGVGDRGGGPRSSYQVPLTGQKRPYSTRSGSPEHQEGRSFAKLFVGSVPRTASEADIRPLFEEHGRVLEIALIKDKRTGQQQGCCFIKYATSDEADRAIRALHNLRSLPGGPGPIQVRYADGERERIGTVEFKLFVGSLNKQATEKEVEQIFSQYGRVEDVYLMRDEMKQSRGCGFVKFSSREMALAAINALSEKYVMRGCEQPLTVRFADPKRPRPAESRSGPALGGPGVNPQVQSSGARSMPNISEPIQCQIPPHSWRPRSPQNLGPSFDSGKSGFGSQFPRTGGVPVAPTAVGGSFDEGLTGSADSSLSGLPVSSSSVNFIPAMSQMPSVAQQLSPLQQQPHPSPQQFPTAFQLQPSPSYIRTQTSSAQLPQPGQIQMPYSAVQASLGQIYLSQQLPGVNGQLPCSQPQIQLNPSSTASQTSSISNLLPHVISTLANQQLPPQQMLFQPQQPTAQMLTQQQLSLQATISHLQQQLGHVQSLTVQQGSQAAKQETGGGTHAILSVTDGPAARSAASFIPEMIQGVAPSKCNWTEHTSPDGFKYYYNSSTGESKWEMPEEFALFEKQQSQPQNTSVQQPQNQPQGLSTQKIHHNLQGQNQSQSQTQSHSQLRQPHQFPLPSQSMTYQAPGVENHHSIQDLAYATQLPAVPSSANDPTRFQQGHPSTQEWMWKNKPAGA